MAACPSVDVPAWLDEQLAQASPDLLRAMLKWTSPRWPDPCSCGHRGRSRAEGGVALFPLHRG